MPDKVQLIKQEIERRIENLKISLDKNCVTEESKLDIRGNITTLHGLLKFIDSLREEHTSVENDCTTCINDKGCVTCENGDLYESASKDRINECPHWEKYWGCETSPMNNCDSCPHAKWVRTKNI